MNTTGQKLRELRKSKRKTLMEVGQDVGMSYSNIASIERGDQNCNSSTLKLLADYYGVTTDYLMGKTDTMTQSTNNDIDAAFYNQHGIISDEQKKDIENFIAFIKSKENL